jgi:hypothetical protein
MTMQDWASPCRASLAAKQTVYEKPSCPLKGRHWNADVAGLAASKVSWTTTVASFETALRA